MSLPSAIDSADLLDRFLRYVRIETRSNPHSDSCPSTACQWDLLHLLEEELRSIGASDVRITASGYVLATLPSTSSKSGIPRMAWFAHADTAPNLPGGAKPIVHRAYRGDPILLPDDPTQMLSVETSPQLKKAIGEDVITASGTTLLGADDKAGIAIVMSAARHLLLHPEIPHGTIRICFNPDEEIAAGMKQIELSEIAADVGYTLDGEATGEINCETFSADGAVLEIDGVASHPGWAKDVMINALRIAGRFLAALPMEFSPERTSERQGFIHPVECNGSAERAVVRMILRDFELKGLEAHRQRLQGIVAALQAEAPQARLSLTFKEQYRNMRYWLEKDMRPVDFLAEAVRRAGMTPAFSAIRGGTDGSNLTARGLPTPNLFTGMHEVHSQREWVTVQDMVRASETLLELARLWEERA